MIILECKICGKELKQIHWIHLQKHNISFKEYKRKFPDAETFPEERKEKQSKRMEEISKNRDYSGENNPNYGNDALEKAWERGAYDDVDFKNSKGWVHSEETKKKISEKTKEFFSDKENHPLYGKNLSEEHKRKISESEKGKDIPPHMIEQRRKAWSGEGNPKFKNWASREPYGKNWSDSLKRKVKERDSFECYFCGLSEDEHRLLFESGLYIHHINGDKKENQLSNLISLCVYCHSRLHSTWCLNER